MCKILAQSVEWNSSAILGGRHIGFIITSPTLSFSTRQDLSFDTHIKGVVKKKTISFLFIKIQNPFIRHIKCYFISNKICIYSFFVELMWQKLQAKVCGKRCHLGFMTLPRPSYSNLRHAPGYIIFYAQSPIDLE